MLGTKTSELINKINPTRSGMNRVVVLTVIAALLCIAGCAFYFLAFTHKSDDWKKNTVTVEKGPIDIRIIATGTIRPVNEVKVSPKSTGLLKKLFVQQGDVVKEGDVIAQMDDSNLRGQIEAVRGTYMMAQDNYLKASHGNRPQEVAIARFQEKRARDIVSQAQQNIIRLRAQIESVSQQEIRDDTMADRQTYLESQGAVSDQDRLNAETQAKVTHANLDAARRELAQAEASLAQNKAELAAAQEQHELSRIGNREEDIAVAKHQVVQAKGNLDTLQSQLNDMTIKAPFAGVITQKYADSGAIVTPTTSAATTSATSSSIVALAGRLEMVAEVAETDIGKISLGQPVEIISNAYPDIVFHGHVTQIAPEAVVTQNVTTFEVHTSIDDNGQKMVGSGGHHRHHRHGQMKDAGPGSEGGRDHFQATDAGHGESPEEGTSDSSSKDTSTNNAPAPKLLSGMNVSARFVAGHLNDALLVPTVCIISRHGKTGVLVAQPDGTPKFQKVTTGPTEDTSTAVLSGLTEGELVFQGLSKDQLQKNGYSDARSEMRARQGGSNHGAPIPRSFGR